MRLLAVGTEPVGVVAIGAVPTGIVAVGQLATGVVAVGQGARGLIALGQLAVGALAFGQLSLGGVWAGGMLAIGTTEQVSMLGFGALGRWAPWRLGPPALDRGRTRRSRVLRMGVTALIVAVVVVVAVLPLVDACLRSGGIFRDAPSPRILR